MIVQKLMNDGWMVGMMDHVVNNCILKNYNCGQYTTHKTFMRTEEVNLGNQEIVTVHGAK